MKRMQYARGFAPHKTPGEGTRTGAVSERTHEVAADRHHSEEYGNR